MNNIWVCIKIPEIGYETNKRFKSEEKYKLSTYLYIDDKNRSMGRYNTDVTPEVLKRLSTIYSSIYYPIQFAARIYTQPYGGYLFRVSLKKFRDYFVTENEYRKLKLQKLNKL